MMRHEISHFLLAYNKGLDNSHCYMHKTPVGVNVCREYNGISGKLQKKSETKNYR